MLPVLSAPPHSTTLSHPLPSPTPPLHTTCRTRDLSLLLQRLEVLPAARKAGGGIGAGGAASKAPGGGGGAGGHSHHHHGSSHSYTVAELKDALRKAKVCVLTVGVEISHAASMHMHVMMECQCDVFELQRHTHLFEHVSPRWRSHAVLFSRHTTNNQYTPPQLPRMHAGALPPRQGACCCPAV